jgi:hypothetical protein
MPQLLDIAQEAEISATYISLKIEALRRRLADVGRKV